MKRIYTFTPPPPAEVVEELFFTKQQAIQFVAKATGCKLRAAKHHVESNFTEFSADAIYYTGVRADELAEMIHAYWEQV